MTVITIVDHRGLSDYDVEYHLSDHDQENLGDGVHKSASLDSLAHNASPDNDKDCYSYKDDHDQDFDDFDLTMIGIMMTMIKTMIGMIKGKHNTSPVERFRMTIAQPC